jgi:peroxiredoxin
MQKRIFGFLLFAAFCFGNYSCNKLNAGEIKNNINAWVKEITTPNKSTLVRVETGFVLKGNIKNKPNHLVRLWEMLPDQLVFIDSIRTDKTGNFVLRGNTKELIFTHIQLENGTGIYMAIDNNTDLTIQIDALPTGISYNIEGNEKEDSKLLKQLIDMNSGYAMQLKQIENQAKALPNTQEAYATGMALQTKYYALIAERDAKIKEMSLGQKEGFIPYFIITYGVLQNPDISMFTHAVDCAQKADKTSKYTQSIEQRYNTESRFMVGGEAPNIKLKQLDGKEMELFKLRGKVVLIDFWASWCGPCRRENPNVRKLYSRFKNKGFEIYGVSLDSDAARWKGAVAADSLSWFHVSDLGGWQSSAAALYQVHSIPQTFLLDKNGRIVAKGLRGEQLEAKLEELLGKD